MADTKEFVAVDNSGCGKIFNYFKICNRVLNTGFNSVNIDRLKAVYTV